jgi:hypothetical protein
VPAASGHLQHPDLKVRNVLVRGGGHHTLVFDRRTVDEIAAALGHLPQAARPRQKVISAIPGQRTCKNA